MHRQTTASLLSHSSFRIHMSFSKIRQKISTGTDFQQEKPDQENQLYFCNHTNPDQKNKNNVGNINSDF